MSDFLLEIGAEEIPHWMIAPALDHLQRWFRELLDGQALSPAEVRVDGTPRRLVVRARGIPERQPDSEELVLGPPKAAAYRDGEPTAAALGFARKLVVPVADLGVETTPKGEYLCYRRKLPGKSARDILAAALPELILRIHWPKTMCWTGKDGPRFIRPIRWIVALLGDEVVPFELAGVKAGRESFGHRLLAPGRVPVTATGYEEQVRQKRVLVSAAERREVIQRGIEELLRGTGLRARPDAELLDTLVYLTEWPRPILGAFDLEFLELPEQVLVTVMRHHQKYVSVEDAEGRLEPRFIAVMNVDEDRDGLIRQGNERVLRARFTDARFFWQFDQRKPLEARLEDLAHVTYQAKLGSYREKTDRIVALVGKLGGSPDAVRAATLCKCDLTTEMVKELPELQGIMGGLYARAAGEPEAVWRAIYEHYRPVSMEDAIPETPAGRLVSLADKLDALEGCFAQGLIPSGSRDPFALRRAAQGVVKILVEGKLSIPLLNLLGGDDQLLEFFRDRVEHYFRVIRRYPYDEVRAGMAAGYSDLPDLASRLTALQQVRPTPDFEPVAASFKRIKNILRQAGFEGRGEVDETLLEAGAEWGLYAMLTAFRMARRLLARRDYVDALECMAPLRPHVDKFFDEVLVNAPDARIRQNRLTLLGNLLSEFSVIADFSEIVTTEEERS